jgi:hypothetical protein
MFSTNQRYLQSALVIAILLLIIFDMLATVLGHVFWCHIEILSQTSEAFVDEKVVDLFESFAARFARSASGYGCGWGYTDFLDITGRQK